MLTQVKVIRQRAARLTVDKRNIAAAAGGGERRLRRRIVPEMAHFLTSRLHQLFVLSNA